MAQPPNMGKKLANCRFRPHIKGVGLTQFMSFRGAKRREIPETCVCKLTLQGFLAPDVARNDI
jgi:hypothetical protein